MCTLNKSHLGLSTSQEVLAGPCLNREAGGIYIYISGNLRSLRKKVLYQWFSGCDLYFYSVVYIMKKEKGTPGFKEFEASSLSGPVIGPAFSPGLGMKAR